MTLPALNPCRDCGRTSYGSYITSDSGQALCAKCWIARQPKPYAPPVRTPTQVHIEERMPLPREALDILAGIGIDHG